MRQANRFTLVGFLLFFLFALSGCGTWVPRNFAKVDEVFPFEKSIQSIGHVPSSSIKINSFKAPYEDVYRAVNIAVSQAQMNVEKEDKNNGIILAMRTIQAQPPIGVGTCDVAGSGGNMRPQLRNYYYATTRSSSHWRKWGNTGQKGGSSVIFALSCCVKINWYFGLMPMEPMNSSIKAIHHVGQG